MSVLNGTSPVEQDSAAIAFLRELVVAQRQGESAVQDAIAARLRAAGCTVRTHGYEPTEVPVIGEFAVGSASTAGRRTALIATLPGRPGKRSLLMFAHPDSEPADASASANPERDVSPAAWSQDPFGGSVDGGRFHGWGVADDLAGCAAAVLALEAMAAESDAALGDVIFASTPSKRYARGVAALLHEGLGADASLYLHPAESGVGMREIKALASSQLEFVITLEGRMPDTTEPGQTAFSHLGHNPVDLAMLVHGALMALRDERAARVRHPLIEARVGRATNLHVSSIRCGTMTQLSRLVERCELGGAISFPPGEAMADVQREVEAALQACADGDDWLRAHPPQLVWRTGVTGGEVPAEHPLFVTAAAAVARVTGEKPYVNPMHTSSDIRHPIVEAGIPTIGLGCLGGDLTQNGRVDEWVDVADFERMVEAVSAVARDWCSQPSDTPVSA